MERGWPTIWHVRRCEIPTRSQTMSTARWRRDGLTSFPFAISRNASISSSLSATIRLSREFSPSSAFRMPAEIPLAPRRPPAQGQCELSFTRRLLCQLSYTRALDSIMMVHFDTITVWL